MVKARTTISIDDDLIRKAQEKFINISGLTESAIRAKLGEITFNTEEGDKCGFCNRELPKATADDPDNGLCWLYPDLKWICPQCLTTKKRHIIHGKKY